MPPKPIQEVEDSDHDSENEAEGSKKGSNSVRKAQNRIAQREFRLRKQQYIRDLEARVEILSGDKEERVELTLLLVRNLLKENKDLRNMLKQMAGFISEGLGSCLPRLGLSAAQLDAILNRSDTDTAYEAFVNLKASKEMEEKNPGVELGRIKRKPTKRKREGEGEATPVPSGTNTPEAARPLKPENLAAANPAPPDSYSYLFPTVDQPWTPRAMPDYNPQFPYMPPQPMYGMPNPYPPVWNQPFGDFGGFGLTVPGQQEPAPPPKEGDKVREAITRMMAAKGLSDGRNMTAEEIDERLQVQKDVMEALKEDEGMRKRTEPFQLIAYHINNFRLNHAYVLPASLRPTAVQRTIPHEHAIDGVPFPSIRDRMILLRGRYDLIDAYQGLFTDLNCRGDDPLDHRNWELSEKWLTNFQILADDEVYAITNRWRQERGQPLLARPDNRQ